MSEKDQSTNCAQNQQLRVECALGTELVRVEPYIEGSPQYVGFWIGKERIGNAEIVNGDWIVQGKRKPVATIKEAAKQMLDAKMNYFTCEKNRYHKLLQKVLST